MSVSSVKHISECFVKPKYEVKESTLPYHLAPMDLFMLSFHYIQVGLLFSKPSCLNDREFSIYSFVESLKESLSLTLVHFYPLAGQLVTEVDEDKHETRVYVDCNKGPGARLIHAEALDTTVSDVLSPHDVPLVVRSFFNLNEGVVNYDSHTKPLLSVQVTELLDGVFIACAMNHCIADGTSYWNFWNIWSEIHRNESQQICESRLPVHKCWFPDGYGPPVALPFTHPNEFVREFEAPLLRDKIFHFSSESIAKLKAKAIEQSDNNNNAISSFQALCALVWRSMVQANNLPHDQIICNYLLANTRHRVDPPLPEYYFGNCFEALAISTTSGEMLRNNLGWTAKLLHHAVANLNDKSVREFVTNWLQSPFCYHHAEVHDYSTIAIGQSPRFNIYGNEFGLGKALALRSGYANKGIGVVFAFPGLEGGGSVDLEVCLPPESMNALESDVEFMSFVSLPE